MTDSLIERVARAFWGDEYDGSEYQLRGARSAIEATPIENYEEALQHIVSWSKAYPLDIFPEPNFKRARELLQAGGISLDAVSASCMRHVVEGVGKIASDALMIDAALGEKP
jgi:hypothetical protein